MTRGNRGNRATEATEATVQPFRDSITSVDLVALTGTPLRRVASTNGGEYAGPCPFCGGRDRFRVWPTPPDGKPRWWCRQCGQHGDAIDFLRERDGLTYRQALERLGYVHSEHASRVPDGQQSCRTSLKTVADRPTWDAAAALAVVGECEAALWTPAGDRARDWLHARTLTDDTLRAWRIGYNPTDRTMHGLFVPRGIVIPCFVDGAVQYVKVRRPVPGVPGPKYQQVAGGKAALFGLDGLTGKTTAIICEAELDAILVHQEAGDLVDVVALGSKSARPALPWLSRLLGCTRWLLAIDGDADDAATWWGFSARVRRVRPLQGNDVTEFAQAGGDLRAWVEFHLAREKDAATNTTDTGDLALYAVRELGAVCTSGYFEEQAEILLSQAEDTPAWRRRWANLALAAGWDCCGMRWEEWAEG